MRSIWQVSERSNVYFMESAIFDMIQLKKRIENLIEMELRSGSMEVITPVYVSRMLNVPLEEVEKVMKEIEKK